MKRRPYQEMLNRWLADRERVRASRTKLGMVGYAHLCAMLRQEPCTATALRQRARLGHVAAYRFLMTMYGLRRVHISGWQVHDGVPALPLFALGAGADVPPPTHRPNGRALQVVNLPRNRLCPSVLAFVNLLRAIEVPSSRTEIVEATGLHCGTVQDALDALVALNLAHVPLWLNREQGGAPVPQYQDGPGPIARKPERDLEARRELINHRAAQSRLLRRLPTLGGATANQSTGSP